MHVNTSVTVKSIGEISLFESRKLKESEGDTYLFIVFYLLEIETYQLLCVIC